MLGLIVAALVAFCVFANAQIRRIPHLGVPVIDYLSPSEGTVSSFHEYRFALQDLMQGLTDDDVIQVVLTPFVGDLDMCVASKGIPPMPSECSSRPQECIVANDVYGDVVSFTRNDPRISGATGPDLMITVHAPPNADFWRAEYSLTLFTTKTTVQLDEGIPQVAYIPPRLQHQFYEFMVPTNDDLMVSVTPGAGEGDPDLYVSSLTPKPGPSTPASQVWHQNKVDYDVVDARANDPRFTTNSTWGASVYQIFGAAFKYSLYWSRNQTYTRLCEGLPLGGVVRKDEASYFMYSLDVKHDKKTLVISVVNRYTSGDPDLYVNGPGYMPLPYPSPEHHQYYSMGRGTDIKRITGAANGTYYIAVHGFAESFFTITVAVEESTTTVITDRMVPMGVIVTGNGYVYFRFPNLDPANSILFNVDIDGAMGGIDLYISKPSSHNLRPNKDKYDYKGEKMSRISVYKFLEADTQPGDYAFSIHASMLYSRNVTVTVSTNQSHTGLRNDREIMMTRVPRSSYRYYYFDRDLDCTGCPVTFTAVPHVGSIELFVDDDPLNKYPGAKEDRKTSKWHASSLSSETLAIYPDQKTGSRFYIGVRGSDYHQDNWYGIIAFATLAPIELYEGYTEPGSVSTVLPKFKRSEYKFYLRMASTFQITLKKRNQEDQIKFYVNYNVPSPSKHAHKYVSVSFTDEFLALSEAPPGWYYIAVEGVHAGGVNTTLYYDIQIMSSYRRLYANRGVSQGVAKQGDIDQIHVYIPHDAEVVLVSNSLISGDTRLFVTTNGSALNVGPMNSIWHDGGWPGNVLMISKADFPHWWKSGCDWGIGIQAVQYSTYFISVDTEPYQGGSILEENFPKLIKLPKCPGFPCPFHFRYRFSTGDVWTGAPADEPWRVRIKVRMGNVGVYVNQDWNTPPTRDTKDTWKSEGMVSRVLELSNRKLEQGIPQLKSGEVFIAVFGLDPGLSSVVEIVVQRLSAPQYIAQDTAVHAGVEGGIPQYYTIMAVQAPGAGIPAMVHLDTCNNLPIDPFYMNVQMQGKTADPHPTKLKSEYQSLPLTADFRVGTVRQAIGVHGLVNPELYYLGIQYDESRTVEIFVQSGSDPRPQPTNRVLFQGDADIDGKFSLEVPMSNPSLRFPGRGFHYEVYRVEITTEKDEHDGKTYPEKMNMWTPCGMQTNGKVVFTFNEHQYTPQKFKDGVLGYAVNFPNDDEKIYIINVLVSDDFGLREAYTPMFIVHGKGDVLWHWDEGEGAGWIVWHVINWILFIGFFVILAGYFLFGTIFMVVKHKERRCPDMIPNVEFWKDFPCLIKDGLWMIFCCGCFRREYAGEGGGKKHYDALEDADGGGDGGALPDGASINRDQGFGSEDVKSGGDAVDMSIAGGDHVEDLQPHLSGYGSVDG